MREWRKKQIEREKNYINAEYFNNIKYLTDLEKVDNRCYSCDVLFNDKLYVLYKYDLNGIRLIPKTDGLFKGDFDDIYEFHALKGHGVLFDVLRKKYGVIHNQYYLCTMNDMYGYKDYMEAKFIYSRVNDLDNVLYKKFLEENVTEEIFLVRCGYERLGLDKYERITELRKYDSYVTLCDKREYGVFNGISDNIKLGRINLDKDASFLDTITNLHVKKMSR